MQLRAWNSSKRFVYGRYLRMEDIHHANEHGRPRVRDVGPFGTDLARVTARVDVT